MSPENSLL